jgi:hypothetical protein
MTLLLQLHQGWDYRRVPHLSFLIDAGTLACWGSLAVACGLGGIWCSPLLVVLGCVSLHGVL